MFFIDDLKYSIYGEDYHINDKITIYLPTVEEVALFGEDLYFHVLNIFCRKPYDLMVELDEEGIDYQTITDWELFSKSITYIPVEFTCILFGKLDFTKFIRVRDVERDMYVLVNMEDQSFVIDEAIYIQMARFLRYYHFISEKVQYDVGNSIAKKFLMDRMKRKRQKMMKDIKNGKIKPRSQIADMIKFCVNNAGFKYDYEGVMKMKLSLLYESYFFIVHGDERKAILGGVYNGTVDTDKMKDKSVLDIIPDLHK